MREEALALRTPDGVIDAILFRPDAARGAIIYLPDVGGIRPSHLERARRIAAQGYTVLQPNYLYRSGKPPYFSFRPTGIGNPRLLERIRELAAPFTDEGVAGDVAAFLGVLDGPVAAIGHCFSGHLALRYAAADPDRVVLAVSFHGGWLHTDGPTRPFASPHLELPRVRARLYFGHASDDGSMPAEAIAKLEHALTAWGGRFESETYPARHGWTVRDSPVHDAAQAARADAKLESLLAETFPAAG